MTIEALAEGFELSQDGNVYSRKFGDDKEYELCFERLLFDGQWYVALYKNHDLLAPKVVVKFGKE